MAFLSEGDAFSAGIAREWLALRPCTIRILARLLIAATTGWTACGPHAFGLEIPDYNAAVNDRFTSGFPTAPVANSSPSFLGADYDWSGVGWSTASDVPSPGFYKGFAMLSPQHALVAQHFYNVNDDVRIQGRDGVVSTRADNGVTNLGYGLQISGQYDLALATLGGPITTPSNMARYAVLDLYATSSSTTYSVYNNLSLLAYGRGSTTTGSPRVGAATVLSAQLATSTNAFTPVIFTARTGTTPSVQLVTGDSGSPLLHGWTNPNGGRELTVLGLNSSYTIDNLYNIMSMLAAPGAMANTNAAMTASGYALRVQGNLNALWTGATNSSISLNGNWSGGSRSDQYVGFQADGTAPTTVNMNAVTTLRGLYFGAGTGASQGFTFTGANVLTIGRGGLTNYTGLRQTFNASLTLGDHQYWDVGAGGVTAGAINTNGKLLEIAGSGTTQITGVVSGTGGLALSGHRLELTGSSSYTGRTWVHTGTLVVDGNIAASSGVTLAAGSTLGGSGRVGAISGSGAVGPGNSPGILTAPSVDGSGGLDFSFEFGQTGAPIWSDATASVNDVLRLTGGTPFTQALTAANVIDIFLGVESVSKGSTFLGGFFTDASADFLGSLEDATFNYYVLGNGLGTAKTYNAQGYYLLDTSFWAAFDQVDVSTVSVASADFAGDAVTNGRVMQLVVVPEPSAAVLVGAAVVVGIARYRRRAK